MGRCREILPRLLHRHRRLRARPLPAAAGEGDPRAGRHPAPRLQPLPHPAAGRTRAGHRRGPREAPRQGLLRQLRRGIQRRPDQDRPQVRPRPPAARRLAALRSPQLHQVLPRPDPRRHQRHRSGQGEGGLRPDAARLPPPALQRPRRARSRHLADHRRHPAGAGPGRRRRECRHAGVPARRRGAVQATRPAAAARRSAGRLRPLRLADGLAGDRPRAGARRHLLGQGHGRRLPDRRLLAGRPRHRLRRHAAVLTDGPRHPRHHLRRQPARLRRLARRARRDFRTAAGSQRPPPGAADPRDHRVVAIARDHRSPRPRPAAGHRPRRHQARRPRRQAPRRLRLRQAARSRPPRPARRPRNHPPAATAQRH